MHSRKHYFKCCSRKTKKPGKKLSNRFIRRIDPTDEKIPSGKSAIYRKYYDKWTVKGYSDSKTWPEYVIDFRNGRFGGDTLEKVRDWYERVYIRK